MTPWHHQWTREWYRITDAEAGEWEEDLGKRFRDITQEEIAKAVNDMTFDKRTPDRPKARHLRMRLYQNRKAARTQDEPERDCAMCAYGWIPVFIDDPNHKWYDATVSVPCLCSAGLKWLDEKYEPHQHKHLTELARRGIKQQQACGGRYMAELLAGQEQEEVEL